MRDLSGVDAVVFRSLPVRDPASLVQVRCLNNQPSTSAIPSTGNGGRQKVLEGLFAVSDFPLRQAAAPRVVRWSKGSIVSGNYFRVLGFPRAGRIFTEDDDRPAAAPCRHQRRVLES
jgi:hypothetical protein